MTTLIETMARAMKRTIGSRLCDIDRGESGMSQRFVCPESGTCRCEYAARAALTAIEASGTHRVVPVEPTERMEMAGKCELVAHEMPKWGAKYIAKTAYTAMLAAAPKVTE